MIEVFNELPLVGDRFNGIDFYRLQKLEHWFPNGHLTGYLFCKNRPTQYEGKVLAKVSKKAVMTKRLGLSDLSKLKRGGL